MYSLWATRRKSDSSRLAPVTERPWMRPARIAGASVMPSCALDMAPATAQNMRPPPWMWFQ
ncbi:hypothetical protein D3C72_2404620 [compost metagenome]